jgi:AAA+ superfamily predicted ATPase
VNPSVFFGMSVEYFLENVVRKDKSPRSSVESEIHVGVEALKCYRLEHGQVAKVYNRGKMVVSAARVVLDVKQGKDKCTLKMLESDLLSDDPLAEMKKVSLARLKLHVWGMVSFDIRGRSSLSKAFNVEQYIHDKLCDKIVKIGSSWTLSEGCRITCKRALPNGASSFTPAVEVGVMTVSTLIEILSDADARDDVECRKLESLVGWKRSFGSSDVVGTLENWLDHGSVGPSGAKSNLLLSGVHGSGKLELLSTLGDCFGYEIVPINMIKIANQVYEGETDRAIRDIFLNAIKRARVLGLGGRTGHGGGARPSVERNRGCLVVLEDIDMVLPFMEKASEKMLGSADHVILNDRKFALQELKRCLSLIKSEKGKNTRLLVCGTTTSKGNLETEAASLFSTHCHLALPSAVERRDTISYFFDSSKYSVHSGSNREKLDYCAVVNDLAKRCNGFARGDIQMLFGHVLLQVSMKSVPASEKIEVSWLDIETGLSRAGSMRTKRTEGVLTGNMQGGDGVDVKRRSSQDDWNSVGGLKEIKKVLNEAVVWPFLYPEQFEQSGILPPCGILMYGPPGTGKTLIAKAVASYAGTAFIAASFSSLMKGDVGASEAAIGELFRRAHEKSPCVIFLDEIQAMFGDRETSGRLGNSMIAQLMMEMDGLREERSGSILANRIVVLGATNRLDLIDPALLRPGRFDKVIHVGLPDEEARLDILTKYATQIKWESRGNGVLDTNSLMKEASSLTAGMNGAALYNLFQQAAIKHLLDEAGTNGEVGKTGVSRDDFLWAIAQELD